MNFGRNQGLTEGKSIEEGLKVMRATKRSLSRHRDRSFDTLFPGGIEQGPADESLLKFNERSSISRIVDPIFRQNEPVNGEEKKKKKEN